MKVYNIIPGRFCSLKLITGGFTSLSTMFILNGTLFHKWSRLTTKTSTNWFLRKFYEVFHIPEEVPYVGSLFTRTICQIHSTAPDQGLCYIEDEPEVIW